MRANRRPPRALLHMATNEHDARAALKSPDVRQTVAAREKLFAAVEALDVLPTSLIEGLAGEILRSTRTSRARLPISSTPS
jgi:hypothetical protein